MATAELIYNDFKNLLKKIWDSLNGNKTIIFSLLTSIMLLPDVSAKITQPYYSIIMVILSALTGGSLIHHVSKGSFRTDTDVRSDLPKDIN